MNFRKKIKKYAQAIFRYCRLIGSAFYYMLFKAPIDEKYLEGKKQKYLDLMAKSGRSIDL